MKILTLLPVIFAMAAFTAPADDADHNRNAVKAAGQLPGPMLQTKYHQQERNVYAFPCSMPLI